VNLLEEYVAELRAAKQALRDSVADGNATSFEEYRSRVGTIKGLQQAEDILFDLVRKTPTKERN
jgi:hypothetical protein